MDFSKRSINGRCRRSAAAVELLRRGLQAELEFPIKVQFKGAMVGDYAADLFVEHKVIVELKVAKAYRTQDEAQLLNELKATGIETVRRRGWIIGQLRTRES
jgi:GxxExxY protein